jgi:hypothetical protein
MDYLIEAVRRSIQEENWYAALSTALTLPDIAAKIDGRPGGRSRYISWCDDYLSPKYTHAIGLHLQRHVFLSGNDCYALRCAFLHEGEFDVSSQQVHDVLTRFHFVVPGRHVHCNQINSLLQLEVDRFCEDICMAVEDWFKARGTDSTVLASLANLPRIQF